ncbi:MAG: UpxY family transcription antiterminator [Terracidiphilus sp.]|nr:UpxY family transcription antiterminator [Terracidiphilus sp.]
MSAGYASTLEAIPEGTRPSVGWFAVYTTSRHEKAVAQHFVQREIEHYLPLYKSERHWKDGSKVALDLPLFPGYIFARFLPNERGRVLNVPGTLAIVPGTGGAPAAMPDEMIDMLRTGLHKCSVEPHALLDVGQRARIRSGAFAGMEGVIVRYRNSLRVVLTVKQIMRSISVEIASESLEPLPEIVPVV